MNNKWTDTNKHQLFLVKQLAYDKYHEQILYPNGRRKGLQKLVHEIWCEKYPDDKRTEVSLMKFLSLQEKIM